MASLLEGSFPSHSEKLTQGSVGQLVGHQLIMGSTAWAPLSLAFVQSKRDDGTVVLFTDAAHYSLVGDGRD